MNAFAMLRDPVIRASWVRAIRDYLQLRPLNPEIEAL